MKKNTKEGDIVKQLYVCSRPILDGGTLKRHLLGILSQNDNGEYRFEYKLGNTSDTDKFLLSIFPEKSKIYQNREVHLLLDDYLPSENDTTFIKTILDKTGMTEYNEWDWLRMFDSDDDDTETKLYETLPDDIICHEQIDFISDNSAETSKINENINNDIDNKDDFSFDNLFDDVDSLDTTFDENNEDDMSDTDISDLNNDEILDFFDDFDFDEDPDDYSDDYIDDDCENADENYDSDNSISIEKPDPTVTIITKTIVTKVKKSNNPNDFITPPPSNPFDLLQQRLEQNVKQRKKKLEETLNSNN